MGDFSWLAEFRTAFAETWAGLAAYAPYLLGALLLLAFGWLVALTLRALTARFGSGINRLLDRLARPTGTRRLQLSPGVLRLIGNIVFWVVMLVFAAMAARVGRLDVFTAGLDRIVGYLPTLIAGGLIVLAGYLVSTLVRDIVTTTVASTGSGQAEVFGLAAQSAVFLTAVVIGLDQIGIDVTILVTLLGIGVGALLLGFVTAFGLGARDFVSNLIASQQLRPLIKPGSIVHVTPESQGEVIEITATTVILATAEGRLVVPAKIFQETATLIVEERGDE